MVQYIARVMGTHARPAVLPAPQSTGGLFSQSVQVQALNIPLVAPSLGGVESLITRPATTTHVGMSLEERQVS